MFVHNTSCNLSSSWTLSFGLIRLLHAHVCVASCASHGCVTWDEITAYLHVCALFNYMYMYRHVCADTTITRQILRAVAEWIQLDNTLQNCTVAALHIHTPLYHLSLGDNIGWWYIGHSGLLSSLPGACLQGCPIVLGSYNALAVVLCTQMSETSCLS